MLWFLCVISTKPFVEWEIEKFMSAHPETSNTIIKNSFYMAYNCKPDMLYKKKPEEDNQTYNLVMGRGYISKSTGYSQADQNDWEKLLNFEYTPKDIDGHYLAIRFSDVFFQATSDLLEHYTIYYAQTDDYFIISSAQNYIAPLLIKRTWNYPMLASLTIAKITLEHKPLLKEIQALDPGSTLTIKQNKLTITKREINFLNEKVTELPQYLFALKKAFELQLNTGDFMTIPFENTHSSRFAFSVWCHKSKIEWGLYCKKGSTFFPEKYIHSNITNNLKIFTIPELKNEKEIFRLYKNYVITTGQSDFPLNFDQAGNFHEEYGINEINMMTEQSEWLFEKTPLKKTEKLYKILKNNDFANFKKLCLCDNTFFRKDFYKYLCKDLEKLCKLYSENMLNTHSAYDEYYFFLKSHQILHNTRNIAWLNNFRHFYAPGLLFSLNAKHLNQRLYNKQIAQLSSELHLNFSTECQNFPKFKEQTYTLPNHPNLNEKYFPLIQNQIGIMIEKAQKIPYYNFAEVLKLFKKAKKKNSSAIGSILKWTAFEIWREILDS